jgi:hypothetical protein
MGSTATSQPPPSSEPPSIKLASSYGVRLLTCGSDPLPIVLISGTVSWRGLSECLLARFHTITRTVLACSVLLFLHCSFTHSVGVFRFHTITRTVLACSASTQSHTKLSDGTTDVSNNRVICSFTQDVNGPEDLQMRISQSARRLASVSGGSFFAFLPPEQALWRTFIVQFCLKIMKEIYTRILLRGGETIYTPRFCLLSKKKLLCLEPKKKNYCPSNHHLSMHLIIGYFDCISSQHGPQNVSRLCNPFL